ncbi:MAG: hypothetical protein L3J47_11450, partial [Sulfurovum sp.]|nr:hypothetical protein [Sulfurovum sp.]
MTLLKQTLYEHVSINVKDDYAAYDPVRTYNFSDFCTFEHYNYRSVTDNNIGNNPKDHPEHWIEWGISNEFAQLDLRSSTRTVWNPTTAINPADGKLVTVFSVKLQNTLSLGNVKGGGVHIILKDLSGNVVKSYHITSYIRPYSNNWFGYYFDAFTGTASTYVSSHTFIIPPIEGTVEVTVDADVDGEASVGYMILGNRVYGGDSLYGARLSIEDNTLWGK